jgi:hypothetical protein
LIVTAANEFTCAIHDRMPVLLKQRDLDPWLAGTAGVEMLRPAPNEALRMWPVSKRVNVSGLEDDDPGLIDPIDDARATAEDKGDRVAQNVNRPSRMTPDRRAILTPMDGGNRERAGQVLG